MGALKPLFGLLQNIHVDSSNLPRSPAIALEECSEKGVRIALARYKTQHWSRTVAGIVYYGGFKTGRVVLQDLPEDFFVPLISRTAGVQVCPDVSGVRFPDPKAETRVSKSERCPGAPLGFGKLI